MNTPDDVIKRAGGIPLKRYCDVMGESSNTVYQRIFKQIWTEGVHYVKPHGTGVWVLLDGVQAWLTARQGGDVVAAVSAKVLKGE